MMTRNDVQGICRRYGLSPNRRLGQNFLVSEQVAVRIAESMELSPSDRVLEIGPGLGALTEMLAGRADVTAVEIDAGMVRYLCERFAGNGSLRIVHADFLKINLPDRFTKIVSNLPYYCSSEILFALAGSYSAPDVFLMLQKEFADRVASRPGSKVYGALTVSLGLCYVPERLFNVGRSSFFPMPKVNSSFIKLSRIREPLVTGDDAMLFHLLVKSSFWGRRKTLLRALASSPHLDLGEERIRLALASVGLEATVRGESLGIGDFARLALDLREKGSAPQEGRRG